MSRKISLKLDRIARVNLFSDGQAFRAVHVAGTNGKGSICHYLTRMLAQSGLGWGRFTSPYAFKPEDAVVTNGRPITEATRLNWISRIQSAMHIYGGSQGGMALSGFEKETAVAISEFNANPHVDVAVIEAGMGGATDATNIIPDKAVTVISKIGLDHTEHLGDSLAKIAAHKAGIMRAGTPCVVDGTNEPAVLDVLAEKARAIGAGPLCLTTDPHCLGERRPWGGDRRMLEGMADKRNMAAFQRENLACALLAMRLLALDSAAPSKQETRVSFSHELLLAALRGGAPIGRMQWLSLPEPYGSRGRFFADGAHNALGADVLARYVRDHIRAEFPDRPITWVVAMSTSPGKDPRDVLGRLGIRPSDRFAAAAYESPRPGGGPGDKDIPDAVKPSVLLDAVTAGKGVSFFDKGQESVYDGPRGLLDWIVQWAMVPEPPNVVVFTGSLYMVYELFTYVRDLGRQLERGVVRQAAERRWDKMEDQEKGQMKGKGQGKGQAQEQARGRAQEEEEEGEGDEDEDEDEQDEQEEQDEDEDAEKDEKKRRGDVVAEARTHPEDVQHALFDEEENWLRPRQVNRLKKKYNDRKKQKEGQGVESRPPGSGSGSGSGPGPGLW